MKLALVLWVGFVVVFAGCGSGGSEAGTLGAFGGPCHPDGSCSAGLHCVDHVCKDE